MWQVDLVRVDLVAVDLVRIDLVTPSRLGACSPRKIRPSEIAFEAMFGPKKLLESPHL